MEEKRYATPEIEIIEVEIEQGFAATGGGEGGFTVPPGKNDYPGSWL